MRILITGAAGFIATNFYGYLTTLEDLEMCLVDRKYGCDLTLESDVERIWKRFEPEVCVNFAGETHVDTSIKDPAKHFWNNLPLMFNVLEACRKHDTRLVQISSSEVYGSNQNNPPTTPMTEEHPLCPHSPYAWTKCCQDRAIYSWNQTYSLNASIVRLFNNFGCYQSLEKMIPKTIDRIRRGQLITVYAEGKARRDWLYVKDSARGIWLAVNKLPAGEVVNLATEKNCSTMELIEEIKEAMRSLGYDVRSELVQVEHVEDRAGHVLCLLGDYRKARKLLGWEPKYSLREGLRETALWYINSDWGVVSR